MLNWTHDDLVAEVMNDAVPPKSGADVKYTMLDTHTRVWNEDALHQLSNDELMAILLAYRKGPYPS